MDTPTTEEPTDEAPPLERHKPKYSEEEQLYRNRCIADMKRDYPDTHEYFLHTILDFILANPERSHNIVTGAVPDWGKTPKPRDTQESIDAAHALRRAQWEAEQSMDALAIEA